MKKEVKGVLVFGGILIIVLAGFYFSYISLKDNLPEEERSFTNFVGNAMKQFANAGKKEPAKIPNAEPLPIKAKALAETAALSSCFQKGCYDSDGNDPTRKGKVYLRKVAITSDFSDKTIQLKKISASKIKGAARDAYYKCIPVDDYCKDTAVIEQTCGFAPGGIPTVKTSFSNCPCGCVNGVCIECQPVKMPDLIVKSIAKKALSEQCLNSFTFTVCNEGDDAVTKEFAVAVTGNEVKREYLAKQKTLEKLTPNGCAEIVVPALFSIGSFGFDLNQNADIAVKVDSSHVIDEKDETNNEKKETVFTGDEYYYDSAKSKKCDTFCYETDMGKEYAKAGAMTFKYTGYTKTDTDFCDPDDLNKVLLGEQYCKLPIILKTNGKFSNPAAEEGYNCLNFEPPRKCDAGQCVPLSITCEDAYGKEGPCLQCLDYEGAITDPAKYQGDSIDPYQLSQDIDPFVKGTIDYTSIGNEKQKYNDECQSSEWLIDYACSEYNNYPLIQDPRFNCYGIKTTKGMPHLCIDGKCELLSKVAFKNGQACNEEGACTPVMDNVTYTTIHIPGKEKELCIDNECKSMTVGFEKCEGPTKETADPFKAETATATKVLGEKDWGTDYCTSYGDSVIEFYCKGKYLSTKETSCDALLDEKGKGASCVNGACAFFDESLVSCKENNDEGIDITKQGVVEYTTGYGFSNTQWDECANEETLIESYCGGKELVIYDHSCKNEGKVCKKGACKSANPELKSCFDQDGGKFKEQPGFVKGLDEYGDIYQNNDYCTDKDGKGWYDESEFVMERFCSNTAPDFVVLQCDKGTICFFGRCLFVDESLKGCKVDPLNEKKIIFTDKFGTVSDSVTQCSSSSSLAVPFCKGNEISFKQEICPAGFECKWSWPGGASCTKADYSLVSCVETEEGATKTNQFGEKDTYPSYCSENSGSSEWVSSGGGGSAVPAEEVPAGKPGVETKKSESPNPEGTLVFMKAVCTGNDITLQETPCGEGKGCNPFSNACDVIDSSKMSCKVLDGGKIQYMDGFGNNLYDQKSCQDDFSVKQPYCDGKEKKNKIILCNPGEECYYPTGECLKVDYGKVSCSGPLQPNFDKKEKVVAYDQFGNLQTLEMLSGKYNEDFCLNQVDEGAAPNVIVEFWCQGNEIEVNDFECPMGKTCKDGACV